MNIRDELRKLGQRLEEIQAEAAAQGEQETLTPIEQAWLSINSAIHYTKQEQAESVNYLWKVYQAEIAHG